MLQINNQRRGSGKTTKVIQLMEEDKSALCLVPNRYIKSLFPAEVQNRVILDIENIAMKVRKECYDKLIIDELLYSRFDLAKLFYALGKWDIATIVYGTE